MARFRIDKRVLSSKDKNPFQDLVGHEEQVIIMNSVTNELYSLIRWNSDRKPNPGCGCSNGCNGYKNPLYTYCNFGQSPFTCGTRFKLVKDRVLLPLKVKLTKDNFVEYNGVKYYIAKSEYKVQPRCNYPNFPGIQLNTQYDIKDLDEYNRLVKQGKLGPKMELGNIVSRGNQPVELGLVHDGGVKFRLVAVGERSTFSEVYELSDTITPLTHWLGHEYEECTKYACFEIMPGKIKKKLFSGSRFECKDYILQNLDKKLVILGEGDTMPLRERLGWYEEGVEDDDLDNKESLFSFEDEGLPIESELMLHDPDYTETALPFIDDNDEELWF